jgi:ATP-dependent Lon protease
MGRVCNNCFRIHKRNNLLVLVQKLTKHNIHLHVPEGAPKDILVLVLQCLLSFFAYAKTSEENMAMTGEITFRGKYCL